jgi:hypothetical protein
MTAAPDSVLLEDNPMYPMLSAEAQDTSVAQQLRRRGFAFDQLDPELAEHVRVVLQDAAAFFDATGELPAQVREALRQRAADGRPAMFTGFRLPGEEYAQVYERPDLMQSFSLMAADQARLPPAVWDFLQQHPYTRRLFAIKDAIIRHASQALTELGRLLQAGSADGDGIDLAAHTFVQVNSYRPTLFEGRYRRAGQTPLAQRTFLQDPHEDGQFLTWAAANDWGLVGRPRDGVERELVRIPPSHQRMLVMPSLPFTYYTGGPAHGGVPPFEHAVLREIDGRAIENRTSLICFVNPNVTRPLPALVTSEENRELSVPLLVNEAQWRFGLPRYEAPERVPADAASRRRTTELVDRLYGTAAG